LIQFPAEIRRKWMPLMATGEIRFSFAINEPDSGSDMASIHGEYLYRQWRVGEVLTMGSHWCKKCACGRSASARFGDRLL
jgi:alkylation response protein AidB-like acyl-CoA dehydrogenase